MRGPTKVVTAALYEHLVGRELRVYFEPRERRRALHSQVERFDCAMVEQKAEELGTILREKGWRPLATE
jgi:hypothetical protein